MWLALALAAGCGKATIPWDSAGDSEPAAGDSLPAGDSEADTDAAPADDTGGGDDTDAPGDDTGGDGGSGYHPAGFEDPAVHGLEAKLNEQDCRDCHGEELTGGSAGVSCDSCHADGWRTDCTFCHGGVEDTTGAPPLDIDGESDPTLISYRAHSAHVTENNHGAYDCWQCHSKPEDVLSEGHLFDATPAAAEVDFAAGLSAAGTYDGAGGCDNLYCHGDGQGDNGSSQDDGVSRTCASCHPDASSGDWSSMSGRHSKHMGEGLACADCHADTTDADQLIIAPELHVDGEPTIALSEALMYYTKDGCTGLCHWQVHWYESW
jgi:predicted CxxxxCH...CXXCH cytochrome family protein